MERKLRTANLIVLAYRFMVGATFFYLSLFLMGAGFSGLEAGILLSLLTIAAIFASFPAGLLNDRFGTSKPLMLGFLLAAAFYAGLSLFSGFWELALLFFIGGLGLNMVGVSINNIIFKSGFDRQVGTLFGRLGLWNYSGYAAGLLLGGLLLSVLGFGTVFFLSAALALLLSAASAFVGSESRDRFAVSEYKRDIFRQEVMVFIAVLFLYTMHWGAEVTSYAPFLGSVLGLDMVGSGIYMAVPVVLLGFSAFIAGKAADKGRNLKKMFVAGLVLSGVMHMLMTVPLVEFSFPARVLHETGDGVVAVLSLVLISRIFSPERRGGNSAFVTNAMVLGQFAGAIIFGALAPQFGYAFPLAASGALEIAAAVLALLFLKNR